MNPWIPYLRQAARLTHLFVRQMEALDRRRVAADERALRLGLSPARRRRRPDRPGGGGSGARHRRDDLADGVFIPDPMPG